MKASDPHRWPVGRQLALVVGISVGLTVVLSSGYFIFQQDKVLRASLQTSQKVMRADLENKGKLLAHTVATATERAVFVMDFLFVNNVIKTTVQEDDELLYGFVMDNKRRVLVHTNPKLMGKVLESDDAQRASKVESVKTQMAKFENADVLEVVSPIVVPTGRWGTLSFGMSLDRVNKSLLESETKLAEEMTRGVQTIIFVALGLMVFGCLIGLVLSREVVGPLKILIEGVARVRGGDLESEVAMRGGKEFIQLGTAFKEMTTAIQERDLALKEYGQHLEEMVRDRTLDLKLEVEQHDQARLEAREATQEALFAQAEAESLRFQAERQAEEVKKLNHLLTETVLKRYLPPSLVDKIISGEVSMNKQAEMRNITVLFSDLVGFTKVSEQLGPEKISALLNEYLTRMNDVIFEHGGTVDKFIGDAVMVMFGAPMEMNPQEQAFHATNCALAMQREMEVLTETWKSEGVADLQMRIGIHQGGAVVGNFGSDRRSDYTCIGPTVNMAARIESVGSPGEVYISEEIVQYLDAADVTAKGLHSLKGIEEEQLLYSVARREAGALSHGAQRRSL